MSTIDGEELSLLNDLEELAQTKKVTIQSWNKFQPAQGITDEDEDDYPF
jgi:hypothetical protein